MITSSSSKNGRSNWIQYLETQTSLNGPYFDRVRSYFSRAPAGQIVKVRTRAPAMVATMAWSSRIRCRLLIGESARCRVLIKYKWRESAVC